MPGHRSTARSPSVISGRNSRPPPTGMSGCGSGAPERVPASFLERLDAQLDPVIGRPFRVVEHAAAIVVLLPAHACGVAARFLEVLIELQPRRVPGAKSLRQFRILVERANLGLRDLDEI